MGEEIVGKFLKFWEGEPMGRGEYFGVGLVWGDDGGFWEGEPMGRGEYFGVGGVWGDDGGEMEGDT